MIYLIRRFGFFTFLLVFTAWLSAWFFLSGASQKTALWVEDQVYQMTAEIGFAVENLYIEGRFYTDTSSLKTLLNIEKGDSIFAFNPKDKKEQLEKLTWVSRADVQRKLPNDIYIYIEERQPLALYQEGKTLHLVDGEGGIIKAGNLKRFEELVIVSSDRSGNTFLKDVPPLFTLIIAEPVIEKRLDRIRRISERRWDLYLKNGTIIKLPEDNTGFHLRRLALLHEEHKIFDKNIEVIDARKQDRIFVKIPSGEVQNYKTNQFKVNMQTEKPI